MAKLVVAAGAPDSNRSDQGIMRQCSVIQCQLYHVPQARFLTMAGMAKTTRESCARKIMRRKAAMLDVEVGIVGRLLNCRTWVTVYIPDSEQIYSGRFRWHRRACAEEGPGEFHGQLENLSDLGRSL